VETEVLLVLIILLLAGPAGVLVRVILEAT
jgi:hypothetical protein